MALGKINTDESLECLINIAKDPDQFVRSSSLYTALGNFSSGEVENILIDGLSDPNWYSRNAALNALYNSNPKTVVKYVIEALKDDDPRIKRNALDLILLKTPQEAENELKRLVNDKDFEVRFYAIQALKKLYDQSPMN